MTANLNFLRIAVGHPLTTFAEVVAEGLAAPQKRLPCRYFYDARGSELFERICELPEYYVTRTERAILSERADDMVAGMGQDLELVEFGSGSGCKTRLLIEAGLRRQPRLHYIPIDISEEFLHDSALDLLADYPSLHITALAAEYNDGMKALPLATGPRLFLFMGSNIGNFERDDAIGFLRRIRAQMRPQDRLLMGVDLIKARDVLEAAYNDAQGVTGAFNKNVLVRINRELDANFDLNGFDHHAPFVEEQARIEMHLVSRRAQTVTIKKSCQTFHFAAGEILHTENSHKYSLARMQELCDPASLALESSWTDAQNRFAVLRLKSIAY